MSETQMTIFVCGACKAGEDGASRPGERLIEALSTRCGGEGVKIAVQPVDCLAVCKRPATISFAAPGKWTYVIGDIDVDAHVDDVIAAAQAYACIASDDFREGVDAFLAKRKPGFNGR